MVSLNEFYVQQMIKPLTRSGCTRYIDVLLLRKYFLAILEFNKGLVYLTQTQNTSKRLYLLYELNVQINVYLDIELV